MVKGEDQGTATCLLLIHLDHCLVMGERGGDRQAKTAVEGIGASTSSEKKSYGR